MPDGGRAFTGTCDVSSPGIVRVDSMGEERWAQCVRPMYPEEGVGLAATTDGGVVVITAGSWTAFPDIDLIRFTHRGDSLWTRSYGGAAEDHGGDVLALADGGFLLVGSTIHQAYVLKTDSLGEEEWSSTFGDPDPLEMLNAVIQTASGDFVVAGTQTRGAWTFNPYAARVTSTGETLWTQVYPDLGPGWFYDVAELPNGDLVFGGSTGFDFLLMLADASGDTVWSRRYGTPISDDGRAMCLAPHGGAAMAGYSHTIASNSEDLLVVRTDSLWHDTTALSSVFTPATPLVASGFQLLGSYPNPFNSTIQIQYVLDKPGRVQLSVYDIAGRLVKKCSADFDAGRHRYTMDGTDLASGCYFFALEHNAQTYTGKMLLLH